MMALSSVVCRLHCVQSNRPFALKGHSDPRHGEYDSHHSRHSGYPLAALAQGGSDLLVVRANQFDSWLLLVTFNSSDWSISKLTSLSVLLLCLNTLQSRGSFCTLQSCPQKTAAFMQNCYLGQSAVQIPYHAQSPELNDSPLMPKVAPNLLSFCICQTGNWFINE